ncbi:MAG TPA: DUF4147 domain-containing protein, partial [Actinomycetota bacterium]
MAFHRAALRAVDPARAVARHLARAGSEVVLRRGAAGVPRRHAGPIRLVAAGKAAARMATAALPILGDAFERGLVIVPEAGPAPPDVPGLVCLRGSHPIPGPGSLAAAEAALDLARGARSDTLLLVLLSGGASALMAAPAEGLTLADKRDVTAALLASGADVQALNVVRRHSSRIKGGGLLRAAAAAAGVWTLALSDVLGDDPAAIGSGPTSADPTTFGDAAVVLARWAPAAAPAIRAALAEGTAGRRAETVKPGDPLLDRAAFVVVGS